MKMLDLQAAWGRLYKLKAYVKGLIFLAVILPMLLCCGVVFGLWIYLSLF